MMYPLQAAQIRNAVIRQACGFAIDRAMRRLHDGPDEWEADGPPADPDDLDRYVTEHPDRGFQATLHNLLRAEATQRYHDRMKTDPSNCRWCGLAAREAREELETEA